jgi:ATP-dependent Lon protease
LLSRAAKLPPHAYKVAIKELQRLKKLAPISPESGIIRTYIELMAELPWSKSSPETLDIYKARQVGCGKKQFKNQASNLGYNNHQPI